MWEGTPVNDFWQTRCHCEAALFRRSNLFTVLRIASGKAQERPRNDMVRVQSGVKCQRRQISLRVRKDAPGFTSESCL